MDNNLIYFLPQRNKEHKSPQSFFDERSLVFA